MSGVALEVLGRVPQTQHVWDSAEPTSKVARSMKGRVAKLERATAALCSGRHPRSFPRQNLVWDSNEQTSDRLNRLRHHGGEWVEIHLAGDSYDEAVSAVWADIVEGTDHHILAANDQDVFLCDPECSEVASLRNVLLANSPVPDLRPQLALFGFHPGG